MGSRIVKQDNTIKRRTIHYYLTKGNDKLHQDGLNPWVVRIKPSQHSVLMQR